MFKSGTLVRGNSWADGADSPGGDIGIILEIVDHHEVPPLAKIMWGNGFILHERTDELQVLS